jgi:hypothetical protein
VERDDASGTQMRLQPPQRRRRIGLELEHVSADDRVERLREVQLGGVALDEREVRERRAPGPLARHCERRRSAVDADDGAGLADEVGREEGDVAAPRADVEDAHPARHARVQEEAAGHRLDQRGLEGEPPQLHVRVAEDVGSHEDSLRRLAAQGNQPPGSRSSVCP